jgi:putative lipoic acid-binding regulatory protein
MNEPDQKNDNTLSFPAELFLKAVYRNTPYITESVKTCLAEKCLTYNISDALSGGGKFISFTISANFDSEDYLNDVCTALKSIDGFMMMF